MMADNNSIWNSVVDWGKEQIFGLFTGDKSDSSKSSTDGTSSSDNDNGGWLDWLKKLLPDSFVPDTDTLTKPMNIVGGVIGAVVGTLLSGPLGWLMKPVRWLARTLGGPIGKGFSMLANLATSKVGGAAAGYAAGTYLANEFAGTSANNSQKSTPEETPAIKSHFSDAALDGVVRDHGAEIALNSGFTTTDVEKIASALGEEFGDAATKINEISPEQLDHFVGQTANQNGFAPDKVREITSAIISNLKKDTSASAAALTLE